VKSWILIYVFENNGHVYYANADKTQSSVIRQLHTATTADRAAMDVVTVFSYGTVAYYPSKDVATYLSRSRSSCRFPVSDYSTFNEVGMDMGKCEFPTDRMYYQSQSTHYWGVQRPF